MVAKQFISRVFDDFIGEYILNISKENIKMALVRGKLKMEDVQLDGDLIGSHILGKAVGLSGFGVLSCYARVIRVSVPWKNLEKEPTRIEADGIHLVCIPLIPSTANRIFGTGAPGDHRCSLRTRAKRSALARLERNFFSRRIPNEGPPDPRILRAINSERKLRKKKKKSSSKFKTSQHNQPDAEVENDDHSFDFEDEINEISIADEKDEEQEEHLGIKLRKKLFRNLNVVLKNIHIRCEVPAGSLDIGPLGETTTKEKKKRSKYSDTTKRSFSFGVTVDSFLWKSANNDWETGNINWDIQDGKRPRSSNDNKNNLEVDDNRYRIIDLNKISFYWDDGPPLMVSDYFFSRSENESLVHHKFQACVSDAMEAMMYQQCPGSRIIRSLERGVDSWKKNPTAPHDDSKQDHRYIINPTDIRVRLCIRNVDRPIPSSCLIELLPCQFKLNLLQSQCQQHKRLKDTMFTQQRIDTMLHQRPSESPSENPLGWWNYTISCVVTCPNSRPWRDVLIICKSRKRYIELVEKKLIPTSQKKDLFKGLSTIENAELLALEDLLPIEALLSFHLLALRRVLNIRLNSKYYGPVIPNKIGDSFIYSSKPKKSLTTRVVSRLSFKMRHESDSSSKNTLDLTSIEYVEDEEEKEIIYAALKRLNIKEGPMQVSFHAHSIKLCLMLLDGSALSPIIQVDVHANGYSNFSGIGNRTILFDLKNLTVFNCLTKSTENRLFTMHTVTNGSEITRKCSTVKLSPDGTLDQNQVKMKAVDPIQIELGHNNDVNGMLKESQIDETSFCNRPPSCTVCRVIIQSFSGGLSLNIAARPVTVVWNKICIDSLANFFSSPSPKLQSVLSGQLRDAATPLAHRAQLALTAPLAISFVMSIDSPKLWIPVSEDKNDGALLIDSGRFHVSFSKPEQVAETHWEIDGHGLQVRFVMGSFAAIIDSVDQPSKYDGITRQITTIVSPFPVHVDADLIGEKVLVDAKNEIDVSDQVNENRPKGSAQKLNFVIGAIFFNLVNVEVLAKAIGKWYAAQVLRVKYLNKFSEKRQVIEEKLQRKKRKKPREASQSSEEKKLNEKYPLDLNVSLEKIEMRLERGTVDPSASSMKTKPKLKRRESIGKKTYVIKFIGLNLHRTAELKKMRLRMFVEDVSIVKKEAINFATDIISESNNEIVDEILVRSKVTDGLLHTDTITEKGVKVSPTKLYSESSDSLYRAFDHTPTKFSSKKSETNEINQANMGDSAILLFTHLYDRESHMNEVEGDIDSLIVRITSTTLRDCAHAVKRVYEIIELATKEMERRTHLRGRVAKMFDAEQNTNRNAGKMSKSDSYRQSHKVEHVNDSLLLLKIQMKNAIVIVGTQYCISDPEYLESGDLGRKTVAAQFFTNALIMFQSVENPDASGTRTLHVSLDDLSASLISKLNPVSIYVCPPVLGPLSAEFRANYTTCNLGELLSQDFSLGSESVYISVSPLDLQSLNELAKGIMPALNIAMDESNNSQESNKISFGMYKEKGAGVSTTIRLELETFSLVILRHFKSNFGAKPLCDFTAHQARMMLRGFRSAMSGDIMSTILLNFFNIDNSAWEYVVEPFETTLQIDHFPNELNLNLATSSYFHMNITSMLLRDLTEFFILNKTRFSDSVQSTIQHEMNQSILLTKSMTSFSSKKLTELCSVSIVNESGFDLFVCLNGSALNQDFGTEQKPGRLDDFHFIKKEKRLLFNSSLQNESAYVKSNRLLNSFQTFSIKLASDEETVYGERELLTDLPILNVCDDFATIYTMPCKDEVHNLSCNLAEPVVESCMQNQRLKPNLSDIFSLQKGEDLLSSTLWSPGDDYLVKPSEIQGRYQHVATKGGNWIRPYLNDDPPEWTDMTCKIRRQRDGFFLPSDDWMWANEWEVHTEDDNENVKDSDGWEYASDFESFGRSSRFYKKNDTCRRRKWTRTRLFKPPTFFDVKTQPLSFVWHPNRDKNGNYQVTIKSKVTIHNHTNIKLSIFALNCCWDNDKIVGSFSPGEILHVPVSMVPISYIRLGRRKNSAPPSSFHDPLGCYDLSIRLMIVPVAPTSVSTLRTLIMIEDDDSNKDSNFRNPSVLHFSIRLDCRNGVSNIYVEPVLKILNMLPCQLFYRLGDNISRNNMIYSDFHDESSSQRSFFVNEEDKVEIADEKKCLSIDPRLKPHISLRIPGYKWSSWNRIINRKSVYETWKMKSEEDYIESLPSVETNDNTDEFKSVVRFEPLVGNSPMTVLVSTECGRCPTVKIYAQYWVLDKTGFGLFMTDGFDDYSNNIPNKETFRKTYFLDEFDKSSLMRKDMELSGHEWSLGRNGMSMFFSKKSSLSVSIRHEFLGNKNLQSKWSDIIDASNPTPKTVLSLDEVSGERRFEICFTVSHCPSFYARTKMITFYPRYQILNLLNTELRVAQDGCLNSPLHIQPQCSIPFHWDKGSLLPQVRLSSHQKSRFSLSSINDFTWTNGTIKLDSIGLTSMRLPCFIDNVDEPTVVQVEVRLASKEQDSAVVVAIWNAKVTSNPLYLLRNKSSFTVNCSQLLNDSGSTEAYPELRRSLSSDTAYVLTRNDLNRRCSSQSLNVREIGCSPGGTENRIFTNWTTMECVSSDVNMPDEFEKFTWSIPRDSTCTFGFEDPNLPHILEWMCVLGNCGFARKNPVGRVKLDTLGDADVMSLQGGTLVGCFIRAEHSTKVIEFFDITDNSMYRLSHELPNAFESLKEKIAHYRVNENDEVEVIHEESTAEEHHDIVSINFKINLPGVTISVVDNVVGKSGREILCISLGKLSAELIQNKDGYHELELTLMTFQLDNHIFGSVHPVMISTPSIEENEPLLHLSVVRSLQKHVSTYVFRYIAFRILAVGIYLDSRTVETLLRFFEPIRNMKRLHSQQPEEWVQSITLDMAGHRLKQHSNIDSDTNWEFHMADSGRIYIEHFHLHPIRISLTFSQEWVDATSVIEGIQIFQFIQSMPSLANAPLTFTSFVVSHAFESPQTLIQILRAHYLSQLTRQIFAILGSLTILNVPADFLANVGTGVRDFFYEPINGLVHGPEQFIEGLETGTLSLARGVLVGVFRGAAQVTELLVLNLVGLTDNGFIAERNAHQRSLTDAKSRSITSNTLNDSLYQAGASIALGMRSGVLDIMEQPSIYVSKYGPAGLAKGLGKAIVGAVLKPMVGIGDAAVVVMNHVTHATGITDYTPKVPRRLRRALPRTMSGHKDYVQLIPFDENASEAQKIVTENETTNDIYLDHVDISSHLMIASERSLWVICQKTKEKLRLHWQEISHFLMVEDQGMEIYAFSNTGLRSYIFEIASPLVLTGLNNLLYLQAFKMGNSWNSIYKLSNLPGIRKKQSPHRFGRVNYEVVPISSEIRDEFDIVENCLNDMKKLGSDSSQFFIQLDKQAWFLINSFGQIFTGLNSRRCIVIGLINGTDNYLQIKSTTLLEGGSLCYRIASRDYDDIQSVVYPGGAIILFAWSSTPNLIQEGHIYLYLETNAFFGNFSEEKNSCTNLTPLSGHQVQFLEKSYDSSGWWAKFWLLVGHTHL